MLHFALPLEILGRLLVGIALRQLAVDLQAAAAIEFGQALGLVFVALADQEQRTIRLRIVRIEPGHRLQHLPGLFRFPGLQFDHADGVQRPAGQVAGGIIRRHLLIFLDGFDVVVQQRLNHHRHLILGVERLGAFLVDQHLVVGQVLEHADAAIGLGDLGIMRERRHVRFVIADRLGPLAEIDDAIGNRPLGLLHRITSLRIFVDDPLIRGDGILPGLVGLVNLPDHGQGLAGIGVTREAGDEKLQHVQGFDPALLSLEFRADVKDRGLDVGIAPAAGEIDFHVGLGGPQRAAQMRLIRLRRQHHRLGGQGMRRITHRQVVPHRDRLLVIAAALQFAAISQSICGTSPIADGRRIAPTACQSPAPPGDIARGPASH